LSGGQPQLVSSELTPRLLEAPMCSSGPMLFDPMV